MAIPLLAPIGYALTALGLFDAGLTITTGQDLWQHAIGWSPYDALFDWLGIGGGEEVVEAVAYDWWGMILKAILMAAIIIIGWSMINQSRPSGRRR